MKDVPQWEDPPEKELYYEVLLPPNSGAIIILQEFPPHAEIPAHNFLSGIPLAAHTGLPAHNGVLGVAQLSFGTDADPEIGALGGWREPAHYGLPPYDHFVENSWLFPIEHKEEVLAFVYRHVKEIDSHYENGRRKEE